MQPTHVGLVQRRGPGGREAVASLRRLVSLVLDAGLEQPEMLVQLLVLVAQFPKLVLQLHACVRMFGGVHAARRFNVHACDCADRYACLCNRRD